MFTGHLVVIRIASLALCIMCSAAFAEPVADKVVSLLKDVCVSPTDPEAIIATGERMALAEKWKLLHSGPAPMPIMHNEGGAKVSFTNVWEIEFPAGQRVVFGASILRPEIPAVRYSTCMIVPIIDIDRDILVRALYEQLGPFLTENIPSQFNGMDIWNFTSEMTKRRCGKQISVSFRNEVYKDKSKSLMFTDFAFPDNADWAGLFNSTKCRS